MDWYCEKHDQEHVSTCCGVPPIEDTDICRGCRDHSGFECAACYDEQETAPPPVGVAHRPGQARAYPPL